MPDAATPNTITEAALAVAVAQLGVHEEGGNNRGPQIEIYLASVYLLPGNPWCAAAMFWCFRIAAARGHFVNPFPRTGSALHVWSLADKHFRVMAPSRGCVYVVDCGDGKGHVGIIESVADNGMVTELSGNTNVAGSREGNSFARHSNWRWQDGRAHGGAVVGYLHFDAAPLPLVA